jgi:hypothetical protein
LGRRHGAAKPAQILPPLREKRFQRIAALSCGRTNSIFKGAYRMNANKLQDLIKYVAMSAGSICNLRCKHCITSTPYRSNPRNYSLEELKSDIKRFWEIFHDFHLEHFDFIGGEPLLNPALPQIMEWCASEWGGKFDELRILTNGSIKISDALLAICKNINMQFLIDDYGEDLSPMAKHNVELLEKHGVRYRLQQYFANLTAGNGWNGIGWIDWADVDNDDIERLEYLRLNCDEIISEAKNLMRHHLHIDDGKVLICDRQWLESPHITFKPEDYIDLRHGEAVEEIRARFFYFKRRNVEHCKHCKGFILTDDRKPIRPAIQLTDEEMHIIRRKNQPAIPPSPPAN